MLKLLQKLFTLIGQEEFFNQEFTQFVVNYAEDLYDKYGKAELIKFINPILKDVELELIDTETNQRVIKL